jgi:hypothetical protein
MSSFLFAPPRFKPIDPNGNPYPAAYLQFYLTGTTTATDAYPNSALTSPYGSVVTADSGGLFPVVYLDTSISYRVQLYTSAAVLIWDIDPYNQTVSTPSGTVVMFMGTSVQRDAAYPPALWALCDGTNSTYDMRDRAPVGAGTTYGAGDALGAVSGTTSTQADHSHGGVTGSTAADLAAHTHYCIVDSEASSTSIAGTPSLYVNRGNNFTGGDTQYTLRGSATTPTLGPTTSTGSGGGHTHTVTAGGSHSHTVATISPGRALWFLMRKF